MRRKALKAAFPHTLPILTGFAFLGLAYGIYMNTSGFPFYYPMLMSMLIFGGSLEFVAVEMLLSPFAPHICEEIWEFIGGEGLLAVSEWPKYDEGKTIAKTVEIGVQVNGKVRGTIVIPNGCEKEKAVSRSAFRASPGADWKYLQDGNRNQCTDKIGGTPRY